MDISVGDAQVRVSCDAGTDSGGWLVSLEPILNNYRIYSFIIFKVIYN